MTTDVLIQVTDLQKHFKGGKQNQDEKIRALDGVSAEIHKGEVVVVIGPSGSGKSTFLRCLNLLELPTGGQILFDGVDITDKNCNINLHRQKMGMVFQHFNLFPHSYENAEAVLQTIPTELLARLRKRGLCLRQLARHLVKGDTVYEV